MIRDLIARGFGFHDGTRFIPTLGLGKAATPAPTPPAQTTPNSLLGLQERTGPVGAYLVPPGFALPVFGRFSKETSNPWFDRQNPYAFTEEEKRHHDEAEIMELAELLEIL